MSWPELIKYIFDAGFGLFVTVLVIVADMWITS